MALVVGSGPNGLAAAVRLAEAGLNVTVLEAASRIGGGTRTSEHTLPGVLHDDCSAFHPTAVASPYLQSLGLAKHGLEFCWPEVQLAHPLDDGTAGVLHQSLTKTVLGLGSDGAAWRRLFAPLVRRFPDLTRELFGPVVHLPRHPMTLARFAPAVLPATTLARIWKREPAKALFGGVAAHILRPLDGPLTSSVGLMLTAAGHAVGWPVAKGGSRSITDALAARLLELGGEIVTDHRVTSLSQINDSGPVILDLAPPAIAALLGDKLPPRARKALQDYRFGPGAFKLDLALDGDLPWTNPDARRAGTVHLGGTLGEINAAETEVAAGRMPERPFVLVGQQYLCDPTRSAGGINPIWAYAHVPAGWPGDATEAILQQIERFAPGSRERVVGRFRRSAPELEVYNANYVGGDIATGLNDAIQVALRPRITKNPYRTGASGFYVCSAATPPGAGVHGMGGFHAAETALQDL